jgi:hypothetical protein
VEDQRRVIKYHHDCIHDVYRTLDSAQSFDSHERRRRRAVQRRLEELAGQVDDLRNTREADRCHCADNGETRPRLTVPLLDLEEFGDREGWFTPPSLETDRAESPLPIQIQRREEERSEELEVATSLNVVEEEGEMFDIVQHGGAMMSGCAEEPTTEYWLEALPPAPRGRHNGVSRGTVSGQRARRGRRSPYTVPVVE